MLLTEHDGKALLAEAGIVIPQGVLVQSPAALVPLASFPVAVKAQVSSGARGLAGGVVKAATQEQALAATQRILATEFGGERPQAVLIESWLPIQRELYISVVVDGAAGGYAVLYSPRGGVHIESGAPPLKYAFGAPRHFRGHALRALLEPVEADIAVRERVIALARRLLGIALAHDCLTVEINPVAQVEDGKLIAADAKIVLDEAAAFRRRTTAAAAKNAHAKQPAALARALDGKLMLVWLDGEIGLISGGAGMTMAAMDLIDEAGGRPACFLDCSNNPTPAGYGLAFELLDSQACVKVILVTIFGGLTQMDRVARVMSEIMAARRSTKPVVFRLNGTHADAVAQIFAPAQLHNHASIEAAVAAAVDLSQAI